MCHAYARFSSQFCIAFIPDVPSRLQGQKLRRVDVDIGDLTQATALQSRIARLRWSDTAAVAVATATLPEAAGRPGKQWPAATAPIQPSAQPGNAFRLSHQRSL